MGMFCAKIDGSFDAAEFDCGDLSSVEIIGGTPKLFSSKLMPIQLQIEAKDGSKFTFDAPEHVIRAIEKAFKSCLCDMCGEVAVLRTKDHDGCIPDEHICEACFSSGDDCMCWDDLPLTHAEAAQ